MKHSSTRSLFFAHIPKCAGLSVYRGLEGIADFPWDAFAADMGISAEEARALVTPFGFEHPELGPLHQAHLPAAVLRDHFPRCLALLRGSRTAFAVLRDPRDRFISALMQHLREFEGAGAVSIDGAMLREKAKPIQDHLAQAAPVHDLRHIHFARQTEFVDLDGERIVDRLFTMDDIGALEAWLVAEHGAAPFLDRSRNRSRQPRGLVRHVQPFVKRAAAVALPARVRRWAHPLWVNSPLYRQAAAGYGAIDLGADTERFIREHYAADAALFAATRDARPAVR